MKQEVLNEVNQMKYLFGYKAGKVISEQGEQPSPEVTVKTETAPWKLKLTNNPQDLQVFLGVSSEDLRPSGLLTQALQNFNKSNKTPEDRTALAGEMRDIGALVKPLLQMAYQQSLDGTKFKQVPDDKIIKALASAEKPEGLSDWNIVINKFSNLSNLKNLIGNLIDLKIKNLGV